MIFTKADIKHYAESDYNGKKRNDLYERLASEKKTYGTLKVELEEPMDCRIFWDCPVKIDVFVPSGKTSCDTLWCHGTSGYNTKTVDTIRTLEIPKTVKKIKTDVNRDPIVNTIWDLEKLILPSTTLLETDDVSFAGLLPKEIYFRNTKGELTTTSKKYKIIQGVDAKRADGSAVLIDLATAKQLIPSNLPVFEFKVLEQEFPLVALQWRNMHYVEFLSLLHFCQQFAIHSYNHARQVTYLGPTNQPTLKDNPKKITLLDLRDKLFLLKPDQSPNPNLMRYYPFLTKENLALISRHSAEISQIIAALWLNKNYFENHLYREDILEKVKHEKKPTAEISQKTPPQTERAYFMRDDMSYLKDTLKEKKMDEKAFRAKHGIALIKEYCFKHHVYINIEDYTMQKHRSLVCYEIHTPNNFSFTDVCDIDNFENDFARLKKNVEVFCE